MAGTIKLHILHCGYLQVSDAMPYGNAVNLKTVGRQIAAPERERIRLPVCTYLIEHPKGLVLVDTGLCREISPDGVYDKSAARKVLPGRLEAMLRPWLPEGAAVHERLAAMGIRAEDLSLILLTHLDADHVAGLKTVGAAQRIVLPEDEYFWSCRSVYRMRQPRSLWIDQPIERLYYRGSPLGPNHWAIDLFGDGSLQMVNVPGHTDGQAAVLIRSGSAFVLLAADAAYSPRNWEEGITPGLGFGRAWQIKSLKWIAEMAAAPDCAAVLCSHDPEIRPQVLEF